MFFSRLKIWQTVFSAFISLFLINTALIKPASAQTVHTTINGKVLFDKLCTSCHGMDGTPPESMESLLDPYPADLRSKAYRYGNSFAEIRHSIAQGRGTNMLPFGNRLSSEQIDAVTQYVISMSEDVNKPGKDPSSKHAPQEVDEQSQEVAPSPYQ